MEVLVAIGIIFILYVIYMKIKYNIISKVFKSSLSQLVSQLNKGEKHATRGIKKSFKDINSLISHYPNYVISQNGKHELATFELDDFYFTLTEDEKNSTLSVMTRELHEEEPKLKYLFYIIEILKKSKTEDVSNGIHDKIIK